MKMEFINLSLFMNKKKNPLFLWYFILRDNMNKKKKKMKRLWEAFMLNPHEISLVH